MIPIQRVGPFLEVVDGDGCRHLLRLTAIQLLSDTDMLQTDTLITAAGRTIRVPQALDEIAPLVLDQGGLRG